MIKQAGCSCQIFGLVTPAALGRLSFQAYSWISSGLGLLGGGRAPFPFLGRRIFGAFWGNGRLGFGIRGFRILEGTGLPDEPIGKGSPPRECHLVDSLPVRRYDEKSG